MLRRIAAALVCLALPIAATAHEFWIDPHAWQLKAGEPITADIRVGQDFEGPAFSFLPHRIRRFDIVMDGVTTPVESRAGDKPALAMAAPADGLAVVVHATTDYQLTYSEWAKFESFLTTKDWVPLLDEHKARGLPETGFRERYSRYAKALIAVGDGAGSDSAVGLETEIVALANPYTDDLADGMPVQVFYQGAPRADAQIELFAKGPDGSVDVSQIRTDDAGTAIFPVQPGYRYLVDAVVLRSIEPAQPDDPVWESLWAALTFAVP
ncbi:MULTISPECIES: DUF4198 domain-containing protein [unclassified Marinovum]